MKTVYIPKILLPRKDIVDYKKWAVIACDQYTSNLEYWNKLEQYIGKDYSTLNMIFPEVYLNKEDSQDRIKAINKTMENYLNQGIFEEVNDFIYVERSCDGSIRKGIMIAVDLENYEYTAINNAQIKATEKTVEERLPARIEVRKDAKLELPHILMLVDDTENKVFDYLDADIDNMEVVYDTELNMGGGHIIGRKINDSQHVAQMIEDLAYTSNDKKMLFVVGDGNHSLATAKECWNNIKKDLSPQERENHTARYALCELVNLQDSSIQFEPIHRILLGADSECVEYLKASCKGDRKVKVLCNGIESWINVNNIVSDAIADLQKAMDDYCKIHNNIEIDYIHGEKELENIVEKQGGVAVFMPKLEKQGLFDYVNRRGVLPRKSFSMGEAQSKRYYIETRIIK